VGSWAVKVVGQLSLVSTHETQNGEEIIEQKLLAILLDDFRLNTTKDRQPMQGKKCSTAEDCKWLKHGQFSLKLRCIKSELKLQ
jgi:hypothetical protein